MLWNYLSVEALRALGWAGPERAAPCTLDTPLPPHTPFGLNDQDQGSGWPDGYARWYVLCCCRSSKEQSELKMTQHSDAAYVG
jgi:hypothetical protein